MRKEAISPHPLSILSEMNFGPLPVVNGLSRLSNRFYGDTQKLSNLQAMAGKKLSTREALEAGLVTARAGRA